MTVHDILLTVDPGLHMLSSPIKVLDPWHVIFGIPESQIRIAVWDTETAEYRFYPNIPLSERLPTPGKAIWIKLDSPIQVMLRGTLPEVDKPFLINLKPGWNMISVPWLVKWKNLKIRKDNRELSLSEAAERGWVYDVLWSWNRENYEWVWAKEPVGLLDSLEPLKGYWILAIEECYLVVPPKDEAKRGMVNRQRLVIDNVFIFSLQASNGQIKQSVWLGCIKSGRGSLLLPPPPQPPKVSPLQMFILNEDGQPMAMDIRVGTGRRIEWDVVMRFASRQARKEEITLTWEGVGYAPRGTSLILIDMATSARRHMRTQTVYQFTPSKEETERRFKIIMEQGTELPLHIANLQVTSLRGQGIMIQFVLTKPAVTRVEVFSLTGREIAVVEAGQIRHAGQNVVFWRGVDIEGRQLPRGVYLLRIHAQDQEGRQYQATKTMTLR